jgi:hypothetical protein
MEEIGKVSLHNIQRRRSEWLLLEREGWHAVKS